MRILNYKRIYNESIQVGDLIRFEDETIAMVLKKNRMVLLKYSFGGDWFDLSRHGYEKDMNKGKYKIIARREDWDIVIRTDDTY